jgi:hypothetical protein
MNTMILKNVSLKIAAPSHSTCYDDSATIFDIKGGTQTEGV